VPSPPSPRPSPAGRGSRPLYAVVARASAAGIVFPLSIVVGYFLGKWGGRALGLYGGDETAGFIGAFLGAIILLIIYRLFMRNRSNPSP